MHAPDQLGEYDILMFQSFLVFYCFFSFVKGLCSLGTFSTEMLFLIKENIITLQYRWTNQKTKKKWKEKKIKNPCGDSPIFMHKNHSSRRINAIKEKKNKRIKCSDYTGHPDALQQG